MSSGILADIAYEGYLGLITHMSYETQFRSGRSEESGGTPGAEDTIPPYELIRAFEKQCHGRRNDQNGIIHQHREHQTGSQEAREKDFFAQGFGHLYQPRCYIGLGGSEVLGLTCADDFDFLISVTAQCQFPVRQASLMFCPRMDSILLDSHKKDGAAYFHDFKDLFDKDAANQDTGLSGENVFAVTYFRLSGMAILGSGTLFQQQIYRAMATKINCVLREMLEHRHSICAALDEIGMDLDADVKSFRVSFLDPQGWADVTTVMHCRSYSIIMAVVAALRSLKFSDLYCEEFIENKKEHFRLEGIVDRIGMHARVARVARHLVGGSADEPRIDDLRFSENHVFYSSYTSTGMAEPLFRKALRVGKEDANRGAAGRTPQRRAAARGDDGPTLLDQRCGIEIRLNFTPGHRRNAIGKIRSKNIGIETYDHMRCDDLTWMTIGTDDFSLDGLHTGIKPDAGETHAATPDTTSKNSQEWRDLVSQVSIGDIPVFINALVRTFAVPQDANAAFKYPEGILADILHGSDIISFRVILHVPVPISDFKPGPLNELVYPRLSANHHALEKVLYHTRSLFSVRKLGMGFQGRRRELSSSELQKACERKGLDCPHLEPGWYSEQQVRKAMASEDEFHRFSESQPFAELADVIRVLRIPSPLSTSLLYNYQTFAAALADPFLFDNVVDLYDPFVALRKLLEDLREREVMDQERLPNEATRDSFMQCSLSADELEQLHRLVHVLKDALMHRIQIVFRDVEGWDTASDFRGGLNRLVSAADAPLKVGMKLIKIHAAVTGAFDPPWRDHVGGVSEITFNPRSNVHRVKIRDSADDVGSKFYLATVHLKLNHLIQPAAYYIHFHEIGHLLLDLYANIPEKKLKELLQDCDQLDLREKLEGTDAIAERCREVFADWLAYRLIFREGYRDPAANVKDEHVFFRMYLARYTLDPISRSREVREMALRMMEVLLRGFAIYHQAMKPGMYRPGTAAPHEVEEAWDDFVAILNSEGRFFSEFDLLWGDEAEDNGVRSFCKDYFFAEAWPVLRNFIANYRPVLDHLIKEIEYNSDHGTNPRRGVEFVEEAKLQGLRDQFAKALTEGRPVIRTLYYSMGRTTARTEGHSGLHEVFVVRNILREHVIRLYGNVPPNSKVQLRRDGKTGQPYFPTNEGKPVKWAEYLVDRNYNTVFVVDLVRRQEYLRERIALIKSLWDLSTHQRARRFKDILLAAWPAILPSVPSKNDTNAAV